MQSYVFEQDTNKQGGVDKKGKKWVNKHCD